MASKLDQLRDMTTVVADTGDIEAIRRFKPVDCTTNPSLVLKAMQSEATAELMSEAIAWGRRTSSSPDMLLHTIADRLAVSVGAELTKLVPGRVSTEVDADLSFDVENSVKRARAIIAAYKERGIEHDRVLIKLAATWEGIRAAEILQKEGIDCNLTLVFSIAQAVACAEAKVFLISPFVGRILDWHVKNEGHPFEPEQDPGVLSVRSIYEYYKAYDIKTVVMAASFRSTGEVEALAGCDRMTIAPPLLEALSKDDGTLTRKLSPDRASAHKPERIEVSEPAFRWLMNENQMATEKLSDGIRQFAGALRELRELVATKLDK